MSSESGREHLSSLMDGELDRRSRRFLLRRLATDADLKRRWCRMHLVRACLQGETLSCDDLVARVAARLEEETTPARSLRHRLLRPVAGAAIAASVAAVAVVGINSSVRDYNQGHAPATLLEQPGFVARSTSLDRPFTQSTVPVSYSEGRQADRQRISSYVMRHHQAAGSTGFVSWVPIVIDMDETSSSASSADDDAHHQAPQH